MQWDSVQAFFDMGGYAAYVWGSFGFTALAMLVEVVSLRRRASHLQDGQESGA
jgi:heme exporter protein D